MLVVVLDGPPVSFQLIRKIIHPPQEFRGLFPRFHIRRGKLARQAARIRETIRAEPMKQLLPGRAGRFSSLHGFLRRTFAGFDGA